ncbi:10692_t:CDS:2, partial [Funneliformis geosporum]
MKNNLNNVKKQSEEKELEKYLQELEDPNYQGLVSQGLPEDPTPLEQAKYEICQNIIRYKRVNNLSTEKLAKQIHLTSGETEEILYCYIDNFTLDRLVNYASQIFKPLEVKIQRHKKDDKRRKLHVTHQGIGRTPKTRRNPVLEKLLRHYISLLKKRDISTQQEIADRIFQETGQKISQPTISRYLKKRKVTHKKINYHYAEQLNHPEKIAKFIEKIPYLSQSPVLAIDECSFHLNEVPRYSYAEKGKRANHRKPSQKGENHTLIFCVQN